MVFQRANLLSQNFPIRVIAVEFAYLPKMRQRFNSHAKCRVRFSPRFLSLLLAGRTSTVATASKKAKIITFTHNNLPLSSLRWKILHFLFSRIDKPQRQFLALEKFLLLFALEKLRDIAFIPSALKRVQRWRVSWIELWLFG